jgi:methylmalonyl-CoA mutase N-terminal domain/subunit
MDPKLSEAYEEWAKQVLEPSLKEQGERKASFETSSSLPLRTVYLPSRIDSHYLEEINFPGSYPYTRGIHPTMYRGRLWTMRQYAGYGTAEETNGRFRYLLAQGQTGLSVAFDLPTQIGYDADDPLAEGEVGRVGVSVSSVEDMARLLEGIPVDRVSTSMTINAPAAVLLAMYLAVADRQGVASSRLRGTIQNDILKEYVARGTYIFPPQPAMRLVTDVLAFCKEHVPHWNTISISGYHMREAGATAVQEVAFTLADAIAYVEAARKAGLAVDDIGPQLAFFFACHNHFLEEIAKFRAARRLWARIMRDRFGARDPRSWRLRFHTQTAGSTLAAQQPANNAVRVALQALAAVLGGSQSIHTNSMDEALGLPTEDAVRLALRTQQIIAHESGVADTVDPMAGSFAVESLTDEIEQAAQRLIDKVDGLGGALAAIQNGFMQREIQDSAYRAQMAVERGDQIVVGVNAFPEPAPIAMEVLRVDPAIEEGQRARLAALRRRRDASKVRSLLEDLGRAATGGDNLVPHLLTCVRHDITLGEICGTLRKIWGEYTAVTSL